MFAKKEHVSRHPQRDRHVSLLRDPAQLPAVSHRHLWHSFVAKICYCGAERGKACH